MPDDPSREDSAGKQALRFLVFLLKLAAYLGGLLVFGFLVFWLRRSLS
jgi:hypothetical protein